MTASPLHHFRTEWAASLKRFERAEKKYADVVALYAADYDHTVTGEYLAASDPRVREAGSHCSYYGQRAVMYALSALVQQQIDDGEKP